MYVCQKCGFLSPRWFGRCPSCEEWDSLTYEEIKKKKRAYKKSDEDKKPMHVQQILSLEDEERLKSGISEFDRVLGGGFIPGSVVLLAGEPGVGKSTLLIQASFSVSQNIPVMYVSSEESTTQIATRLKRIASSGFEKSKLYILFEDDIEKVLSYAEKTLKERGLLILDAIQSFYTAEIESAPGTVSQVRETASKVIRFARYTKIPVIIVGHITKEGIIAGPKTLEHMVDVVLYLESEGMWRVIRATKNRFGSTGEMGIFTMTGAGLKEVQDPTLVFFHKDSLSVPGSALSAIIEGTRVYIVEIQSLVSKTHYSLPRRFSQGYDISRLNTLIAVLEKIVGLSLWDKDVFLNVVGGIQISDVASDLAVASAVLSSYYGIPLEGKVAIGEIGLLGEVRPPSVPDVRFAEISRLKRAEVITGEINQKIVSPLKVVQISSIKDLADYILKKQ